MRQNEFIASCCSQFDQLWPTFLSCRACMRQEPVGDKMMSVQTILHESLSSMHTYQLAYINYYNLTTILNSIRTKLPVSVDLLC